jgi:hypothetical protein
LLRNDGTGAFVEDAQGIPGPPDVTTALAFADLDGDGLPELVVGNGSLLGAGRPNRLYANRAGRLTDASERLPAHADPTSALALADVDTDGDLDLFVGNGGGLASGAVLDRLYANDGRGAFVDASERLSAGGGRTSCAAFGDSDQDGDPDLWLARRDGVALLENQSGRFGAWPRALPEGARRGAALAIALADFDADGDPDAFLGGRGPEGGSRLLAGDGRGAFLDATSLAPGFPREGLLSGAALARDLSGDGRADLLLGACSLPEARGRFRLFLGQEPLSFAEHAAWPTALEATAVAAGDLDGDGTVDLVIGHWLAPVRVYLAGRMP